MFSLWLVQQSEQSNYLAEGQN